MTAATTLAPAVTKPLEGPDHGLLAGITLSSFSALLLEMALTRLFSVVLFYHFAFLAISIALLGLGTGGVVAYLWKNRLARVETRKLAAGLCAVNAVVVVAALEIVLHIPVKLGLSPANFLKLTELYLASAVPFFLTGLMFSVVFARESQHIPRLYGADLVGGAAACLATVPLLNWMGGPNTVLFAGFMMAVAGLAWSVSKASRRLNVGLALALLLLIGANYSGKLIDVIYAKGLLRDASWVEFARWNAISRVEVDLQGDAKAIVIDADASTYLMSADPKKWQDADWRKELMSAPPAVVNVLRPTGDYAIIGPGGGVDVLRALAGGSPSVTGIEINPTIANTIMRDRYADYVYHLYQRPDVHIHVTDGRSFLRNSSQRFDVIQMTLVDTWASTAAGAFALSENNLYTVEAFREYFEHLKPDGMIAVTRWEFQQPREALRVVSVAIQALHELGVPDAAGHFMVVAEGDLDEDGIPVVVLAKKTPFTPAEESAVKAHLSTYPALDALYLPSLSNQLRQNAPIGFKPGPQSFNSLITIDDPKSFADGYPYDVSPVTDDAPFFFFTLKTGQLWRPGSLRRGIDWKVNRGVVVLGMVLLISLLAVLAFLVVPLALRGGKRQKRVLPLLYFIVVGLGYILVEIAFIQRFVLFLGHPTYALTVVVFLMLLSSGVGSLVSRRWLKETARGWLPLALIIAALLLYVYALPGVLHALVGLAFAEKLLVSAILLVPLGFAMGMPFPTGLRALASLPVPEFPAAGAGDSAVEWAWAMNAASSVLGSVLAIVIAIHLGLNVTLACGASAYFVALLLSGTLQAKAA
jgi:hypothetical protein